MKTNVLMLDTMKNMENLIYSAFSISNWQKRKLKIAYIEDFNWVSSANYIGLTPSNVGVGAQFAETQVREDYQKAKGEIKRIADKYFSSYPQHIPFEIDVREYNRLEYIDRLVVEEMDVLLMISNYRSISEGPGGLINFPNILDKVECPVLVIPDDRRFLSFNKLIYATAMHSEDIDAIRSMAALFSQGAEPKINIFHYSTSEDFNHQLQWKGFQALVREVLPGYSPEFYLAKGKNVDEELENYITMENPDLIAALKERKGFFEDIFSSSHTHELIKHLNKPVLVYHEESSD